MVAAGLADGSISTGYGVATEEPVATEEAMAPAATEEVAVPVATEEVAMAPAATEEVAVVATEEAAPVAVATEEPVVAAADLIDCTANDLSGLQIGLVTDVGQINDKSFNQSSWEGVLAAEACGAQVDYIETQDPVDYADNIAEFAEQDYNVIVTVGFALGTATAEAAATYPDITFIGVDQFQGEALPNVIGLVFHEDHSGFLAGVLAARLTQSGTIAAVLGTDQVPPVVAFKEGYEAGARYVNPDINLISTYHPGAIDQAFVDPEWGATTARQALDQGADVVFGAGGKTGNGALIEVANAAASGNPPYCIGVDSDQWETVPEAHPCLVSSAMKLLDSGVATIITQIAAGTAVPGNFFGEAGLAPFHDFADAVPADVQAELETVAAGLADGSISTGYGTTTEEPAATEEAAAAPTGDLGVITVGMNAEYPPFEFVNEDGDVAGFDVDMMNAIAADAGFEIEFVNTRWDGIFVALQSGEFDAVSSAATITDEREEIVDFSNPYFNAGQMIAVREEDAESITTTEDLAGRRVGVQNGTTGDIQASEIPGVEVVRYDEITLAFQALANGDINAIINDGPVSADIIGNNPEMNVVLVGEPLTDEFYGVAVNPERPELLDAINASLANIISNGTYATIYETWFGMEPPEMFQAAE
jgi:basic membrane protein A